MINSTFILTVIAAFVAIAGLFIGLMTHIDGKIDTKIKEIKDDIHSTNSLTNAKIDLFFNKIANENTLHSKGNI
ncbi:MAG: hypothetical protein ACYCSB_04240 [bacterium]